MGATSSVPSSPSQPLKTTETKASVTDDKNKKATPVDVGKTTEESTLSDASSDGVMEVWTKPASSAAESGSGSKQAPQIPSSTPSVPQKNNSSTGTSSSETGSGSVGTEPSKSQGGISGGLLPSSSELRSKSPIPPQKPQDSSSISQPQNNPPKESSSGSDKNIQRSSTLPAASLPYSSVVSSHSKNAGTNYQADRYYAPTQPVASRQYYNAPPQPTSHSNMYPPHGGQYPYHSYYGHTPYSSGYGYPPQTYPQYTNSAPTPHYDARYTAPSGGFYGQQGQAYHPPQHFATRPSSSPVRFPNTYRKTAASRIPDDTEEPHGNAVTSGACSHDAQQSKGVQAPLTIYFQKPDAFAAVGETSSSSSRYRTRRNNAGKRNYAEVALSSSRPFAKKPSLVSFVSAWDPAARTWVETVYFSKTLKNCSSGFPTSSGPTLFDDPGHLPSRKKPKINRRQMTRKKATAASSENENEEAKRKSKSLAIHVAFDRRYLRYDKNSQGCLDQLVWRSLTTQTDQPPSDSFLEPVPDDPIVPSSSSRIGCRYQARVGKFEEYNDKYGDEGYYLDDNDIDYCMWDPVAAENAKKRGQDIDGFLAGDHELMKHQILMELLHIADYDVEAAKLEYDRIVKYAGGEPSTAFDEEEGQRFEKLLKKRRKDFKTLSKIMQRTPVDCMIYYYRWKRTKNVYTSMKSEWKSDWCAVCDDGGDMIICEKCQRPYHPGCLNPPLKKIPTGDWFCPKCVAPSQASQQSGRRGRRRAEETSQPVLPISVPSAGSGN